MEYMPSPARRIVPAPSRHSLQVLLDSRGYSSRETQGVRIGALKGMIPVLMKSATDRSHWR